MWLALFVFIGILAIWRTVMMQGGRLAFWQVASNRPDDAFEWFQDDPVTWTVVPKGDPKVDALKSQDCFSGPFSLYVPSIGQTVAIFGNVDLINRSQDGFLEQFGTRTDSGPSWASSVALVYPGGAILSFFGTDAPFTAVLGFGFANLGYLLVAAGIFAGHFRTLGLNYRSYTIIAGVGSWIVGVLLSNL